MSSGYRISRVTTAAPSHDLITLGQAKAALGIAVDDTSQDAAVGQHIAAASLAVENYCDRVFVVQTYRDQWRTPRNRLMPGEPLRTRQFPIITVAAITDEAGATLDPLSWEVENQTGAFYRLDGVMVTTWTGLLLTIDYDAGFDPIPSDVQAAALEWFHVRWIAQGRDPMLQREIIPDVRAQHWAAADTVTSSVPPAARDYLAPYRLWSV